MFLGMFSNQHSLNIKTAAIFSKCVSCHEDGDQHASLIPFSDAQKLKIWLEEKPGRAEDILNRTKPEADPPIKMPFMGELEDFEYNLIKDYLHSAK